MYGYVCFHNVFTEKYISRVIGSNPEIIVSIVNLRINVISSLDSLLLKKMTGKAEQSGLGLDALKFFLLRCLGHNY